jgi:outer membrane protein, heavy metal efflux system
MRVSTIGGLFLTALCALQFPGSASAEELAPVQLQIGREYTSPPPQPEPPKSLQEAEELPALEVTFSLEDLLRLAAQGNPTLRQARMHVSAELGKALEAGLYPNPQLAYEAEQIFVDSDVNGRDTPGEFQGGVFEQRIVTAHKLRLSRAKYMRRVQVAEHLAMAQQFRVYNDVRIHFYRAVAAAQVVDIRRELLKTAEDRSVTARELYNMGQARVSDIHRANIGLQRARLDVATAESQYAEQFRRLTSLVGAPATCGRLAGVLTANENPLSFDEAYQRIVDESPELMAARAKLAVDQMTVRRERVEWVPDLVVHGGTGYNFEVDDTVAMAGVRMELPLFDRNQGTIRQAQADFVRQQGEIERIELQLRDRLAGVYREYSTALLHAREYERVILPESQAAYEELLESYQRNRIDWPDVLSAQHDYFDARLAHVGYLEQVRTNEVLIDGFLLHDGLMAAESPMPPGHIEAVPKPR